MAANGLINEALEVDVVEGSIQISRYELLREGGFHAEVVGAAAQGELAMALVVIDHGLVVQLGLPVTPAPKVPLRNTSDFNRLRL